MPEAEVSDRAYIARFCSIGFAKIGEEVMLADQVQILSGGNEHGSGDDERTMHEVVDERPGRDESDGNEPRLSRGREVDHAGSPRRQPSGRSAITTGMSRSVLAW